MCISESIQKSVTEIEFYVRPIYLNVFFVNLKFYTKNGLLLDDLLTVIVGHDIGVHS